MDLFKSLNREGQTIVMVTHNPENTSFSTRTISLKDGRVETAPVALEMKSKYLLAQTEWQGIPERRQTTRHIEFHRRPSK